MMKKFFIILLILISIVLLSNPTLANDNDDWGKYLDVYNSDGLDRPVTPQEYKETMDTINNLKNKKNKKSKNYMPPPHTQNAPIQASNSNILRIEQNLFYDNIVIPAGFYKIVVKHDNEDYYVHFFQGKNSIASIKAQRIKHTDFSPEKVSSLETKTIDDKYFKIMYKNIDVAICAYLAILPDNIQ